MKITYYLKALNTAIAYGCELSFLVKVTEKPSRTTNSVSAKNVENIVERGKIAPEEQFLSLSTLFYYLMLDFYVKTGIRFSVRDKRLFEITKVDIRRVECN